MNSTDIITVIVKNLKDIVTIIVAVYGAILSTYNFLVERRKHRPSVNVKISQGFLSSGAGDVSDLMLFLSASNPGEKAVTLASHGFELPNKKNLVFPRAQSDVTFPCELLPEKGCQVWMPVLDVARALRSEGFSGKVKLVGFYRDQVGRTHRSKPYEFNVDEWIDRIGPLLEPWNAI